MSTRPSAKQSAKNRQQQWIPKQKQPQPNTQPSQPKTLARQNRPQSKNVVISQKDLKKMMDKIQNHSSFQSWTAKHVPQDDIKKNERDALMQTSNNFKMWWNTLPLCVRNFTRLASNPFTTDVPRPICNPQANTASVTFWSHHGRAVIPISSSGEFAVLFNSFNLTNDGRALVFNDNLWNSAGSLSPSNPNMSNYYTNDQLPYKQADLESTGAYTQEINARLVTAGICVEYIGNATQASGQVYACNTQNNALVQTLPTSYLTAGSIAPKAVTELGKCYSRVFTSSDPSQVNYLEPDPAVPKTHPFDPVDKGFNLVIYGAGFTGGSIALEWAVHCEYSAEPKFASLTKTTEHHPQQTQKINAAIATVQKDVVQAKPKEGFFDKVVHFLDKLAEPVGHFLGGAAKALVGI